MWYNILEFLNIAGVISNAFLIAFTSSWGAKYNDTEKLWIVIIFEVNTEIIYFCFQLILGMPPRALGRSQIPAVCIRFG